MNVLSSESDSSDEEFLDFLDAACYIPAQPKKRQTRERVDFFLKFDDIEFENRFRLTKTMARELADILQPQLKHRTTKNRPVSVDTQVLVALRYYATGSYETIAGDLEGIHQTTAGRIVKRVTHAIASLAKQYIKMPIDEQEQTEVNRKFYHMGGIPRVIGVIDGCHIPIISPGGEDAEKFHNRKGWFSINTMGVCDADMKIINIVARWPGATHDQTVFSLSQLRADIEGGMFGNNIILGDSGYRCTPYLITPLLNPVSEPEKKFQRGFIKTRNIIERVFGVWKRRFPVVGMKMRMEINEALVMIVATAVLHNICIRIPPPEEIQEFDEAYIQPNERYIGHQANRQTVTRNSIIENYFS